MKTTQNARNAIIFTLQPEDIRVLTDRQVNNRMKKIADLDAEIKKLQLQRDEIANEIKAAMTGEVIETAAYKVMYKDVTSHKFDGKAFKADHADLYKAYTKPSTCKRFTYTVK